MNEKNLFLEVMSLAYEVNRTTNHEAFVEYHPHVNCLTIRVYKDGWSEHKQAELLKTYLGKEVNGRLFGESTIYEIITMLKGFLKDE